MKQWNNPEIMELNLTDTAHTSEGVNPDGGYIGDGMMSGHLFTGAPTSPVNPLS